MKVCFVSHSGALGGAELSLYEAAKGLRNRGHEPHVVMPAPGALGDRLASAGVDVSVVRYPLWVSAGRWRDARHRLRRLAGSAVASRALAQHFRRLGPDVVVTNTLALPSAALAAWRLGLPHVWYIHEFGEEDHGLSFDLPRRISHRLIDRLSARVLVNSRAVQRSVEAWVSPERVRLAYYAVEVSAPDRNGITSNRNLQLVLLGRMAPGKRQEEAIRAAGVLAESGISVQLTLVGTAVPEYRDYLAELVCLLGLERQVRFVPFTDRAASYLASADAALMCSRMEAFGRVTVEAMKLGKPVIGANSGGTPELIQHGVNGLLYRPGDPHDLAQKIASLWQDRSLLLEMGRRAEPWAMSTFNLDRYAEALVSTFEEAMGRVSSVGGGTGS